MGGGEKRFQSKFKRLYTSPLYLYTRNTPSGPRDLVRDARASRASGLLGRLCGLLRERSGVEVWGGARS